MKEKTLQSFTFSLPETKISLRRRESCQCFCPLEIKRKKSQICFFFSPFNVAIVYFFFFFTNPQPARPDQKGSSLAQAENCRGQGSHPRHPNPGSQPTSAGLACWSELLAYPLSVAAASLQLALVTASPLWGWLELPAPPHHRQHQQNQLTRQPPPPTELLILSQSHLFDTHTHTITIP